jgi:folate-binding protein YgfZ
MDQSLPNPLLEVHRQAEAEFQNWAELPIVQTFGEPQAEYAAIRKSVGMMDLPQRGALELRGKDRLPFLNNLLTNQTWNKSTKTGLMAGQGVYAFMLNLRGRVVADVNVIELGDRTLLEMESRLVEPLRQVLDKYLFVEQVSLESRVGQLHEIALHGPAAARLLGVTIDQPLGSAQARIRDIDTIIWRDDPAGVPGYHLILPIESARLVWMKLLSEFQVEQEPGKRLLRPVGWGAFNAARIEAGRPVFGIDFDGAPLSSALPGKKNSPADDAAGNSSGSLPAETGLLHRAVSLTKGCYLGQEIVARMDARKQIARQVIGIRMESDALPIASAQVFDGQNAGPIGMVTSSTISPLLSNTAICLAMVKRPYFAPGTKLRIPAEGSIRTGMVVQPPFVDGNTGPRT